MKRIESIALVVIVGFFASSLALPETGQRRQSCSDGRICQCRRYLGNDHYENARSIVQCLDSLGYQHDFSRGATHGISGQVCNRYQPYNIIGVGLRKCFWRKAGVIRNINGQEQWDVEIIRRSFMETALSEFSGPQHERTRQFIINTLNTCVANPRDFSVMPLLDCFSKLWQKIRDRLRRNYSNKNLAKDVEMVSEYDEISRTFAKAVQSLSSLPKDQGWMDLATEERRLESTNDDSLDDQITSKFLETWPEC